MNHNNEHSGTKLHSLEFLGYDGDEPKGVLGREITDERIDVELALTRKGTINSLLNSEPRSLAFCDRP